jgi:metal-sulfur cluster biosynthetic enzyme
MKEVCSRNGGTSMKIKHKISKFYNIEFDVNNNYLYCTVTMTLTSPTCPVADSLLEQVKYVTLAVDEIDEAFVKLVFSPPWSPEMMSEDAREIMGASGAAMPF